MLLDRRTLSDDVAKIIRKKIFNGELKPGERINQVQFAEELSISRGPLREALRLLQNEGLVKYETNKGTYVSTLSEKDAYEIYSVRALLESKAAELAVPHLTNEIFIELDNHLKRMEQALEEQDIEKIATYDIAFHGTVVKASQHDLLIHLHKQLDIQVGAMFFAVKNQFDLTKEKVLNNHTVVVDALLSKNNEKIKQAFSHHYAYPYKTDSN